MDPDTLNSGNIDDFTSFYAKYYTATLATARAVFGDRALAEDAAAEAFARAFADWPRIRNLNHPIAWTTRVALNHGRRQLRRASIERRLLHRGSALVHEQPPEVVDATLWAEVRRLPLRQRTALALRYMEQLSQADVAHRMGIRPGTAGALLTQGRQTLRKALTAAQEESSDD